MSRSDRLAQDNWDPLFDVPPEYSQRNQRPANIDPVPRKHSSFRARFGVKHLLQAIALSSLLCMSARSLLFMDPLGILFWPVLLGFGTNLLVGGDGIVGGTIGGLLLSLAAFGIAGSGPQPLAAGIADPWFLPLTVLSLNAGGCWGFYLSVWVYLIVETILQSF
jgi:hypothetical protein